MTTTTVPTPRTALSSLTSALSLRVITTTTSSSSSSMADEKRMASPVGSDADPAAHHQPQCSPTSDDEKSAVIPTTAELQSLVDATPNTIHVAIQTLQTHDSDWLEQHEAITTLRQIVFHHTALLTASQIHEMVAALVVACDNLRSALAKNALLALSECFGTLDVDDMTPFLTCSSSSSSPAALVDVLLRRATCEKRFLRDAAAEAVDNLVRHLASRALVACAAHYAASKNAKIVAVASRIMAQSFARLRATRRWDVEQFASDASAVYVALAKFRAGKEATARAESMACLRLLGESLGKDRFTSTLSAALPASQSQAHSVACIVSEVFPASDAAPQLGRRGSLKDRMLSSSTVSGSSSSPVAAAPQT